MSTSPEDTTDTSPTETPEPDDTTGDDTGDAVETETTKDEGEEAFLSAAPTHGRGGGLFGPETFGVAGALLLGVVLFSTELVAIFNQYVLTGASGVLVPAVQGQLTGAGLFSALAVASASAALFRATHTTRPWARHLAAATILVGLLAVLLTVLSYVLLGS